MRKFIQTKTPFLLICLFFILFNTIFLIAVPYEDAHAGLWLSFACLNLSIVIIGCVSFFLRLRSLNSMTTVFPFLYSTLGYFVVSLIANLIMIFVNSESIVAGIIVNLILLVIYAALFLLSFRSFDRVEQNTAVREKRVRSLRETSVKINALIFLTEDPAIKQAIKKLKENVDYSSSATTESARQYEEQINDQIETISSLLNANAEQADVLKAIQTAENLLKVRNQMIMIR